VGGDLKGYVNTEVQMKKLIILIIFMTPFIVNAGATTAAGTVTLTGNGGHGAIVVVLKGSGNTVVMD